MHARLQDNLTRVQQRIRDAAIRSGRTAEDVTLVAVTKYAGAEIARALVEIGCSTLGESRPQELWRKHDALADTNVEWHLIGHLQRNKAKRTLPMLCLFHACDSRRMLTELQNLSVQRQDRFPVLIEVNISGDESKHGFPPGDIEALLADIVDLNNIQVRGLMAMASLAGDQDQARKDFAQLRQLRDRLRPDCPKSVSLDELSMGMSRDFEVAIEEGATMVRVGSALFEGIEGKAQRGEG